MNTKMSISAVAGKTMGTERPVVDMKAQNPQPEIDSVEEMQRAERQGEIIPVSEKQLIHAIERAIKAMQGHSTTLEFSIHEKTKQIMVKVLDKETGEIIREIPPEKIMDFVAKLWEMAGLLIDERR